MARKKQRTIRVKGVTKETEFDYKEVGLLKKFVSESGRILPRSRTGLTAKQQRRLAQAIKRARILALLPFTVKE